MPRLSFLTSSLVVSFQRSSVLSYRILDSNSLLVKLREAWKADSKMLIIASSPESHRSNIEMKSILRTAFKQSGLTVSSVQMCDHWNPEIVDNVKDMDAVVLVGGHVPTQNTFMESIHLREKLKEFKGILLGWSAGSMNCADVVYAIPELDGEAVDPKYKRYIPGLGVTQVNILPHFQIERHERVDGQRVLEDLAFPDSFKHEVIAINDGSWILIDGETETLYGEGYRIKDGKMEQICSDNESVKLK